MGRYVSYNADGTLGTGRYRERPKYKETGPEDRRRHQAARDRERENIKKKPRRPDNKLASNAPNGELQPAPTRQPALSGESDFSGVATTIAMKFAAAHRPPSTPHISETSATAFVASFMYAKQTPTPARAQLSSAKKQSGSDHVNPNLFIDLVLDSCPPKLDNNGAALTGSELRAATDDLARSLSRRDLESAKRSARLLLLQGRTNRSDLRAFCMRNL